MALSTLQQYYLPPSWEEAVKHGGAPGLWGPRAPGLPSRRRSGLEVYGQGSACCHGSLFRRVGHPHRPASGVPLKEKEVRDQLMATCLTRWRVTAGGVGGRSKGTQVTLPDQSFYLSHHLELTELISAQCYCV